MRALQRTAIAASLGVLTVASAGIAAPLKDWPRIESSVFQRDAAQEARIAALVAGMSLAQKVGQMTQPEIQYVTPDEVTRYHIGSVLNGGGTWPGKNKQAEVVDWLKLAQAYHEASLKTPAAVPVIWGTDAVHGHNNVRGATIFPHNIGLGAAGDAALVEQIGAATARAVRATGIAWIFAPTLAVVQDPRWGRTYESYSSDPRVVREFGRAYVRGVQGKLGNNDDHALATAKHYIGDGSTEQGRDQGHSSVSLSELINVHGQGYYGALEAGVQTVMVSFNSWREEGKLHGSRTLLTGALKEKMGFDGLLVTDWNGIGQVKGCSDDSCAQAINAGVDMVMVPERWKPFIANTIKQVERGEIPMSRIDDAVTRILRVKLRAGVFEKSPMQNVHAGKAEALLSRELARRAVRESLVLLKQQRAIPLTTAKRILVVGKSADSLENQTGGWSLSWQGTGNTNADFPNGETVLAGIRKAAAGEVVFSRDGSEVDVKGFDAVIAVVGETPYAEFSGDIPASGTLRHSSRYPEDLAVLKQVAGKGVPVLTVLISGRPLWVNDLMNLSDTFVAAWLPGTEGGGVVDVLFGNTQDFRGRLPFDWPAVACPSAKQAPLFKRGYGLMRTSKGQVKKLDERFPAGGCGAQKELRIFAQSAQAPYEMLAGSGKDRPEPFSKDLSATQTVAGLSISTVQVNAQQDGKRLQWTGPAEVLAWSGQKAALLVYADAALQFDLLPETAPAGALTLRMGCGEKCGGALDLTSEVAKLPLGKRHGFKIPLACFAARGADLNRIDVPFHLSSTGAFTAAIANIRISAGAARDKDALRCPPP